jgi:hypothetical protein
MTDTKIEFNDSFVTTFVFSFFLSQRINKTQHEFIKYSNKKMEIFRQLVNMIAPKLAWDLS